MLKRKNRITLNKEFDHVFKNGKSFYNNIFGFKVVINDKKLFRFGILLGLKVSKKAVVRNRFKRQIRSIIQQKLPLLKQEYDFVIIVLPKVIDCSFDEIEQYISQGLNKLGLYK